MDSTFSIVRVSSQDILEQSEVIDLTSIRTRDLSARKAIKTGYACCADALTTTLSGQITASA
jgi:hypothetical protein